MEIMITNLAFMLKVYTLTQKVMCMYLMKPTTAYRNGHQVP